MPKTPVHLITGFLGSGKTTLIKRLLDNYAQEKKLAVIQNEFASHNIDGKELQRTTTREFDLLEVNNGSVFCVCLLSDFKQSFVKFFDKYKPDLVLFEASGLSDPISVGEIFNAPELQERVYLASTICIVDASNFLAIEKLQQRMIHQVQIANHLILNKIDLPHNSDSILRKLNQLNPHSKKSIVQFCNVDMESLSEDHTVNKLNKNKLYLFDSNNSKRPDIKSVVFKTTKPLKLNLCDKFLEEITENLVRLKGYVLLDSGETLAVQFSGNSLETETIKRNINQTEIIAMGYKMAPSDLKIIYRQYC